MKKNILKYTLACIMALSMGACNDFFEVQTDDILDSDGYINEESEMYAGFIGIATRVQVIGDKIIYLTDTRGEILEPTRNTPDDLHNIYNYDTDLTGNTYADPATYYDVIIACNDYLSKVYDYKEANKASVNMTDYKALVSATVRIKAWTYLTIAKIYGEAIWFDNPIREKTDMSQFPVKSLSEVVKSCMNLLDTGFDGINGDQTFIDWVKWIDPNGLEGAGSTNKYYYWNYMAPPYFALYAELCLWNGDYAKASNLILTQMNAKFKTSTSDNMDWMRNDAMAGKYAAFWNTTGGDPYRPENIAVITYDYKRNQTNSLLKHFGTEIPNQYLLAPSAIGIARFSDPILNPLGGASADPRGNATFKKNSTGNYVIQKFRPLSNPVRTYAYQDDVPIYIYRGADLYFMLAEALNNQGRFEAASVLINKGVDAAFIKKDSACWEGFTWDWTSSTSIGTRKYPDKGIRGMFSLGNRTFIKSDHETKEVIAAQALDKESIKANDEAILDEMLLEFSCEGKNYPAMIRMALRHNDMNIIADRVCPKYTNGEGIRAKIQSGGYFIKWNLKNK